MNFTRMICLLAIAATSLQASAAEPFIPSTQQICKAAIGAIMGREPLSMKAKKRSDGIVEISYIRADDGSKWAYRCKLEGSNVIWASEGGRWRNDPRDEKISYTVKGATVEIVQNFGDGSTIRETYKASRLNE